MSLIVVDCPIVKPANVPVGSVFLVQINEYCDPDKYCPGTYKIWCNIRRVWKQYIFMYHTDKPGQAKISSKVDRTKLMFNEPIYRFNKVGVPVKC